jgi:hypothetical protein
MKEQLSINDIGSVAKQKSLLANAIKIVSKDGKKVKLKRS